MKGHKIHALVDSEGLPMRVIFCSLSIRDRDGAAPVLDKIRRRFPWLELIWADGVYNVWRVEAAMPKDVAAAHEIRQMERRRKGFVVLPRRSVVEPTFSWFGRSRCLAKNVEKLAETLATHVTLAPIQLALGRLARA